MNRRPARRTRRRLIDAAYILGALTLAASTWAGTTPGTITGAVLLAGAGITQTVLNRRPTGPQQWIDDQHIHHDNGI